MTLPLLIPISNQSCSILEFPFHMKSNSASKRNLCHCWTNRWRACLPLHFKPLSPLSDCMWAGKNCRGLYNNTPEKNHLKTNTKTSTGCQLWSPWSSEGSRLTGRTTRPMSGSHREVEAEGEVEDGIVDHVHDHVQLPVPAPNIPTF